MIIRCKGGLPLPSNNFTIRSSPNSGLMLFRGLNVRWMMTRMLLMVVVVVTVCGSTPAAAADTVAVAPSSVKADLLGLNLPPGVAAQLPHGALIAPIGKHPHLPLASHLSLPEDPHQLLGRKPAALAVAIGVKNIVFPTCSPQVAHSVKDQLGIAKFWNLWNISDAQASSFFPPSANNKSTDERTHPCTIFAVSDDGIEKSPGLYSRLTENPFEATEFVASHILARPVNLQQKDKDQPTLKSIGGLSLKPVYKDGVLFINSTKVTMPNVKLAVGGFVYVLAEPLCCTKPEVLPLSAAINASNPNLDIASFVFDRPSISYLRRGHILPKSNYTVAARRLTLARGTSPLGNGTDGIARYIYHSPASIWGIGGGPASGIGSLNDSIYQSLPGLSGTTFVTLLQLADCRTSLKGGDPLTVFMPTDEALAALPPKDIQSLVSNPEKLRQTLLHHIAPGTFTSSDLSSNVSITTVEGKPLRIDTYGNTTLKTVERAKVILSDIIGHNGVIHIIDRFLYPVPNNTLWQICETIPNLSLFISLIKRCNLTDYLKGEEPYTIFAPTDDALKNLTSLIPSTPEGNKKLRVILLNHIVPGAVYTASWAPAQTLPTAGKHTVYLQYQPNESGGFSLLPNGATVSKSDLGATNGVLHIINQVMPIDYAPTPEPQRTFWKDLWSTVLGLFGTKEEEPAVPPEEPPKEDIISTLKKIPNAKDMLDALNFTNQLDILEGEGPFTVFVPVNSAFGKLKRPFSDIASENPDLADDVLKNHIVPQRLYCEDLKKLTSVTNVLKVPLLISPSTEGCAKVDDSNILYWNITATNGIIHLVDMILRVEELLPEDLIPTTEAEAITTTEIELTTEELLITTEVSIPTITEAETETPTTAVSLPTTTAEKLTPTSTEEIAITTEAETVTPPITPEVTILTEVPVTTAAEETTLYLTTEAVPSTETIYTVTEAEITSTVTVGREFPGYPTLEEPISKTTSPRPEVNFTVSVPPATTLMDALRKLNLTTFPNMLNLTDLDKIFPEKGPITIFAPTDDAFNKLDIPTIDKLLNNPEQLRHILQYHVVQVPIQGKDLLQTEQALTIAVVPVFITVYVIKGKPTPFVNNATIYPTQHEFNGTIIYLIDQVLISPPDADIYSSIPKTLKGQTMIDHITKLRLDPLLTGPGPITVFVPSDEAWSKLPEDIQQQLASNETALRDYILSHIVKGAIFTPVMTEGTTFNTVNGKMLTVTHSNGYIKINNAIIILPDIVATNGVIHVIDMVFPIHELPQTEVLTTPATVAPTTTEIAITEITSVTPITEVPTTAVTPTVYITEVGVTEVTSEVPVTKVEVTEVTSEVPVTKVEVTEVTSVTPVTEVEVTEVTSVTPVTEVEVTEVTSEVPVTKIEVTEVTETEVTEVTYEVPVTKIEVTEVTETEVTEVTSEVPVTAVGITEITSELPTKETGPTEEVTAITPETVTTVYPVLPLIPTLRNRNLTILADLLESIFAPKILNLYGLFTLFAPTNKAFEGLPPDELDKLKSSPQALQQMLLYNVINRILPFSDITDNLKIPSIQGTNLTFHVYDNGRIKTVLGSQIIKPDILVQDGLVHIIDKLLYPIPRLPLLQVIDTNFPTFSAAVNNSQNRPTLQGKDVTAFVPAEAFWARLPQPLRESILSNTTLMNDLVKDQVCQGKIFKVGIHDGFSCTSLSGKTLNFTVIEDAYYIQQIPIVIFDIIDTDGVIHVIDYPLFLEIPGYVDKDIIGVLPPRPTRPPPKKTTEAPITTPSMAVPEVTAEVTKEPKVTTAYVELTTAELITTERVPKELNITAPVSELPTTVREEITTETVVTVTETTTASVSTGTPEVTKETTATASIPEETETPTIYLEVTSTEKPVTPETTISPEHTTTVYIVEPNVTIPHILQQQFQDAGYPIEVSQLTPRLPDTTLYTAFIPYSVYLSGLPTLFLEDLAKNDTAVGEAFANHICPGATYSPDFKDGFSCNTLGYKPIRVTVQDGKYYCNGFPIIQLDIPAMDGVVHLINGLLFFEPQGITPTPKVTVTTPTVQPEITETATTTLVTLLPEITSTEVPITVTTEVPEISTGVEITTPSTTATTEIEEYTVTTNVTIPAEPQVTEIETTTTTLEYTTVTRKPKELNITEPTEVTTPIALKTTEVTTAAEELTTITTAEVPVRPSPAVTELTTETTEAITEEVTGTTKYPVEIISTIPPAVTTERPTITPLTETEATTKFVVTELTTATEEYTTTETVPETTTITEYITVAPNDTIVSILQQQFEKAGYDFDATLFPPLPDTYVYTAFIPYYVFLSGVPVEIIQNILTNKTAATSTWLNHICQDATYSRDFVNGFQCISLNGKPINVTVVNGRYYSNGFPIIQVDIPVLNGVVHIVSGLLFFEPEGITPVPPTEIRTGIPSITPTVEAVTTTAAPEVTEMSTLFTGTEETTAAVTVTTVLTTATREPKELNFTEATEVYLATTEVPVSTLAPEITTSTAEITESVITEGTTLPAVTTLAPEVNVTTEYPAITKAVTTRVTEETSVTPTEFTSPSVPLVTTEVTEIPSETVTPLVTETMAPTELTTVTIPTPAPNETIPSVFGKQFEDAGYPVDVQQLQSHMPDTYLYTACIPYSTFLSQLPGNFLPELTGNTTALNNALLNHVCQDATFSRQFGSGYTCTSLGGRPIIFTLHQGQYYCNNFPIIKLDIPTVDGVVHLITGILFFEPEGITPPALPEITTETTVTVGVTIAEVTEETTRVSEETSVTPIEFTSPSVPLVTTEVTEIPPETVTPQVTETTPPAEPTTVAIPTPAPNETTPSIFGKQFEDAGYPIDVQELQSNMPDTYFYTACIPYSAFLSQLPDNFLLELTRNTTALNNALLNHVCRNATFSQQFGGGYTCTSLGGRPIVFTLHQGQYYCNNFPIIKLDIPTVDGVVHLITGILFFEPEGITPLALPEITTETTVPTEVTTTEVTEEAITRVTEETSVTPIELTSPMVPLITTEVTEISPETVTSQVTETTTPAELTTVAIPTPAPNETIPSVFGKQFEDAGYPIDVQELQSHMPDTYHYTACIPYSTFLSQLPSNFLLELTGNTTALNNALLNHICQDATFSHQFGSGYTCTSLGGRPIIFTLHQGQYYCNNFPIIKLDIPTVDGVVHLITGILFFEPEGITPPALPEITTETTVTVGVTITEVTEETTTGVSEETSVTPIEFTSPSVPLVTTEVTETPPETVTPRVTETTAPAEPTTVVIPTPAPNETIPSVFGEQFEDAGYPIDVQDLQSHMPDTYLYTACIPYSTFLSQLPENFLPDLTRNTTALNSALLNHVCRDATFSRQFGSGYTCISLGGRPIVFSLHGGQYYCNNFPIITLDISTVDGVVHLITGILFFESEGITPPALPEITTGTTVTVGVTTAEVTEEEVTTGVTEETSVTPIEFTSPSVPLITTEVTEIPPETVTPKVTETTTPVELTTVTIPTPAPNETIPSVFGKQFEDAGYPIDVQELQSYMPDTYLYTACIPYSTFLSQLPYNFLPELTRNTTALNNALLNHVCQDATFSRQFGSGYTCTSLGGRPIVFTLHRDQYYCNGFPIIKLDIPTVDGVVHFITGILFFEPEGITPPSLPEITTETTVPVEVTTAEVTEVTETKVPKEVITTPEEEATTPAEVTVPTTLVPATREPKELNFTVTEAAISTELPEVTTKYPEVVGTTESTAATPEATITTEYAETSTVSVSITEEVTQPTIAELTSTPTVHVPEVTEVTTETTSVTVPEEATTGTPVYTETPEIVTGITVTTELTTIPTTTPMVEADETIPTYGRKQFEDAGYPVDITELAERLPFTQTYTACLPSYAFLVTLPQDFLQRLTQNTTALTDALLNHICTDTISSVNFGSYYTCTSLGGPPIVITARNGQYYCNGFPIIRTDIYTLDGIVHLIDGLLSFEPQGITPPPIPEVTPTVIAETSTEVPFVTSAVTTPEELTTMVTEVIVTTAEITTLPTIAENVTEVVETTPYEAVKVTTLITATREPKEYNLTEAPEVTSVTTELPLTLLPETTAPTEFTETVTATTEAIEATTGTTEVPEVTEITEVTKVTTAVPETTETGVTAETTELEVPTTAVPEVTYATTEFAEKVTATTEAIEATTGTTKAPEVTEVTEVTVAPETTETRATVETTEPAITVETGMPTTAVPEVTVITTGLPEVSTVPVVTPLPNETIPSFIEQQFENAGYPIDTSELKPLLPDIYRYTACVPYSQYLSELPKQLMQDLTNNTTLLNNALLNHICQGLVYSSQFQYGYTCMSLGGKPIILSTKNGQYYCNNFPIIVVDVPTADGVIHIISGLLFFEPEGITPPEIEYVTTVPTLSTSAIPEVTITEAEVNVTLPAITVPTTITPEVESTPYEVTETTTLVTATRVPKILNISEPTAPSVTEETTATTEYTIVTTEAVTVTTPVSPAVTEETEVPTVPTEVTEVANITTVITEHVTTEETLLPTEYTVPSVTKEAATPEITEITAAVPEFTTARVTTVAPNETISSIIETEFENAGYPIDVTELQANLPVINVYTACIPHSVFLAGLPVPFVEALTQNTTAITNSLLNHICQDATYSPAFRNGFTCTSLGGRPIVFTFLNGNYYCNGFPIIRLDIPATDGVVHLIDGLLFFEPEGVTPPVPPTALPTVPPPSTVAEVEITTGTTEAVAVTETTVTPGVTEIETASPEFTEATMVSLPTTEGITGTTVSIEVTEVTEVTAATTSPTEIAEVTMVSAVPEVTFKIPEITTAEAEVTTVTPVIATAAPNESIPNVFEQQFEQAGYPINTTGLQEHMPDVYKYTACIPSSTYLQGLPILLLQDLTTNSTVTTNALLNHVCQGASYISQLQNGFTCWSLGGRTMIITHRNGQYFCNQFPVVRVEIPATDGVIYIIDGLLFFEREGVTPPPVMPEAPTTETTTAVIPEVTITEVTPFEITTETVTLVTATREPKYIELTKSTTVPAATTETLPTAEVTTATEYPIETTEVTVSTERPSVTIPTTSEVITAITPEVTEGVTVMTEAPITVTTEYPKTAATSVSPAITEVITVTTEYPYTEETTLSTVPEVTKPTVPEVTATPLYTATPEVTEETTTTISPELTTPTVTIYPNETIPSIFEQQFENAGFPIDTSNIPPYLPEIYRYTACVPHSAYLQGLPSTLLRDLSTNKTATTNALLNHICQGETESHQFQNPFTCTSLGGSPVILKTVNGQYYCNDFLIIKADIPTVDGVVHVISGLLYIEHKRVTPALPPKVTTAPYPTTALPEITETPLVEITTATVNVTEIEITTPVREETTLPEFTEPVTLITATREPKELNVTEPTVVTEIPPAEYTTQVVNVTVITEETTPAVTEETTATEITPTVTEETTRPEITPAVTAVTEETTQPEITPVVTGITEETTRPEITPAVTKETTRPGITPVVTEITEETTRPEITPAVTEETTRPEITPAVTEETTRPGITPMVTGITEETTRPEITPAVTEETTRPEITPAVTEETTRPEITPAVTEETTRPEITPAVTEETTRPEITPAVTEETTRPEITPAVTEETTRPGITPTVTGITEETTRPEITPAVTEETTRPEITPAVTEETTRPEITPAVTEETTRPEITPAVTEETTRPEITPAVTEETTRPEITPAVTEETTRPEITPAVTEETATPAEITPAVTEETTRPEITPAVTEETTRPEITPAVTEETATPAEITPAVTKETTLAPELTTPTVIISPNETIPSVFEHQFKEAGYPINTTDVQMQLPETYRYTACVPYSNYLAGLPTSFMQDLTANQTAVTNALLNHICQGPAYSPQFKYNFKCSSLSGTLIVMSFKNGRYYCNDFPIIKPDVPTRDGVVHIIDGLLFFEPAGITPPAVELTTPSPATTPAVTEVMTPTPSTPVTEVTAEETTPYEVTELTTTLITGTREPKVINFTEPTEVTTRYPEYTTTAAETTVPGVTKAEVTLPTELTPVTELTELTPTEYTVSEISTVPERTTSPAYTVTEGVIITTEYPEITTTEQVSEITTLHEATVPEAVTTSATVTPETTVTEVEITEITEVTGPTTVRIPDTTTMEITTSSPNETIPSVLEKEFQQTGYPVDVSELIPRLPDRYLYTAFLPYHTFLLGLPASVLQDLAGNKTAAGGLFANHICPEATYSTEFQQGFSCTAIGGAPIVVTIQDGKYFVNGIPIIRVDIPAADGVIHLINGLLFFEFVTPAPAVTVTTEKVTKSTPYKEITEITGVPVVTTTPTPVVTEVEVTTAPTEITTYFEGYTTIMNVTLPAEAQMTEETETTPYEVTEAVTLITATREPKELNITEAYTVAPEETTISREITEVTPTVTGVTNITLITEYTEATESTTAEYITEKPTYPPEYTGITEEVSTLEYVTTEATSTTLPTKPPTLVTKTPTEYAVIEETTAPPMVTENATVTYVEYTTEETTATTPFTTEITSVPVTAEVETTFAVPENETLLPEMTTAVMTTEVTGITEEATATTESMVTAITEVTTTEVATTAKYPELFNVTTEVPEYTSPAEETTVALYPTTSVYPEENITTTIPFYPSHPPGVLSVSIFFYLVDLSGIDETLSRGGPYTILAPVDAAFHALPVHIMTQLRIDIPFLKEVLLYHIIPQRVPSRDFYNDYLLTTLQGQDVRCNVYGPVITLGGAKIIIPDSTSGYDGVLHIVNRVLYPVPVGTVMEAIAPRNDTDKVQALIRNTTLPARLKGPGPFTVFLPSDRALNSLPSYVMDILEHNSTLLEEFILSHIVNGTYYTAGMTEGMELTSLGGQVLRMSLAGGLTVNGVPIVSPDISVTNGVVHIIDKILYDPSQELFIPKTTPVVDKDLNIVQLMKKLNLTTFSNLLADAGLSVNLSQPGYFTVFAPTNEAFEAMPPNQLETIKADRLRLIQILLYHILPVQIETSQMSNEMVIPSLLPTKSVRLNIYVNNRGPWYTASGSQILLPNNVANNGVVHIVHQVLYIPLGDIVQTVEKCSILQTLRHIIKVSGLEDQLRGGNYTLLAPNDAAFNKLPEDALDRLLVNPHLARLFILGHLLRGTINTEGIFDESTLVTSSNNHLYVRALKDCILLNSAAIQYPDVTADNGVVHVIDRVL